MLQCVCVCLLQSVYVTVYVCVCCSLCVFVTECARYSVCVRVAVYEWVCCSSCVFVTECVLQYTLQCVSLPSPQRRRGSRTPTAVESRSASPSCLRRFRCRRANIYNTSPAQTHTLVCLFVCTELIN